MKDSFRRDYPAPPRAHKTWGRSLACRYNLASTLDKQGKYAEAEEEHQAVLKLRKEVLGTKHPDTLRSRNMVAGIILLAQGKYAEAEQECRAVLKLQEEILGAKHPDTLNSRYHLAYVLYNLGKHVEAKAEFRTVLRLREEVLGKDHPYTLETHELFRLIE